MGEKFANANRILESFKVLGLSALFVLLIFFLFDRGSNALLWNAQNTGFQPQDIAADESPWRMDNSGWYYTKPDGSHYSNTWAEVDGVRYYFKENGAFASGFTAVDGKTMYFDALGQRQTSTWMRNKEGVLYHLNASGEADTGWYTDTDGKRYHMDESGACQIGIQRIDDAIYYFNEEDASMQTGLHRVQGLLYNFGTDGRAAFGWQTIDGSDYFFSENGDAFTGWHYMNDNYYYFNQEGIYDSSRVFTEGPRIALTFDDGPGKYTDELLDILDAYNAKATFFMLGREVEKFPEAVLRESQMDMEQGNHSWDHTVLTDISDEEIQWQIASTNNLIEQITGEVPTVFRPPGGGYNDRVIANSFEMPLIMWSVDTLDWETRDPQNTYNMVMSQLGDGKIILLHEIYEETLEAVRMLLPDLIQQGYQLVTVTELAESKGVTLHTGEIYAEIH